MRVKQYVNWIKRNAKSSECSKTNKKKKKTKKKKKAKNKKKKKKRKKRKQKKKSRTGRRRLNKSLFALPCPEGSMNISTTSTLLDASMEDPCLNTDEEVKESEGDKGLVPQSPQPPSSPSTPSPLKPSPPPPAILKKDAK